MKLPLSTWALALCVLMPLSACSFDRTRGTAHPAVSQMRTEGVALLSSGCIVIRTFTNSGDQAFDLKASQEIRNYWTEVYKKNLAGHGISIRVEHEPDICTGISQQSVNILQGNKSEKTVSTTLPYYVDDNLTENELLQSAHKKLTCGFLVETEVLLGYMIKFKPAENCSETLSAEEHSALQAYAGEQRFLLFASVADEVPSASARIAELIGGMMSFGIYSHSELRANMLALYDMQEEKFVLATNVISGRSNKDTYSCDDYSSRNESEYFLAGLTCRKQ